MAIHVDAYTNRGMARGILGRPGVLREALEDGGSLPLDRAAWLGFDGSAGSAPGSLAIPRDDVLVAVSDDDSGSPVHAAWHHIELESGPYAIEGDLATLPGFDPGRALTRPSGQFLLLRDVHVSVRDLPEAGVGVGDHALVNRYAVDRIRADLMLGFFFPGAMVDQAVAT